MKDKHRIILKEIIDEVELLQICGAEKGSGDWATGAQTIYGTAASALSGKSCSWPGGFYSSGNPIPSVSGGCVGGAMTIPPGRSFFDLWYEKMRDGKWK